MYYINDPIYDCVARLRTTQSVICRLSAVALQWVNLRAPVSRGCNNLVAQETVESSSHNNYCVIQQIDELGEYVVLFSRP